MCMMKDPQGRSSNLDLSTILTNLTASVAEFNPQTFTFRHSNTTRLYAQNVAGKVFRIDTVRYNWPMSAHASQAFSIAHCTDSEDLPVAELRQTSESAKNLLQKSVPQCHTFEMYASTIITF